MNERSLQGRRILVVEDEYLIGDAMQLGLKEEGVIVVGPAPSIRKVLRLLDGEYAFDGAVLDMNLGEKKVIPVKEALRSLGAPFRFTTGYDALDVPQAWHRVRRLEKPIEIATITRAYSSVARASACATSSISAGFWQNGTSAKRAGMSLLSYPVTKTIGTLRAMSASATS